MSWGSTLLYHHWLCHHLGTGILPCNILVLSDRRNLRLSRCSPSLAGVKKKKKRKKKLVTSLASFWFFIFLIHSFHFTNSSSYGWTIFADENSKSKVKNLWVEVKLYIRKLELQIETSVNIWRCRCIVTPLGLTALHWMCSWVKEQIAFVFLDSETTGLC